MSLQDFLEEAKASGKENYYLGAGANVVRFLTKPIMVNEAFCIAKTKDKKTGEEKVMKRSEISYKGCGYEKYAKPVFVAYIIDPKDQTDDEGAPRIKTISFGWKVLEGLVAQENAWKEQGAGEFPWPMAVDTIITKTGTGLQNTSYSVALMLNEKNNKVTLTQEEIASALALMPTLKEWKEQRILDTQERHAKFGLPKAEKQIEEEEKASKGNGEAVVQLDVDDGADDGAGDEDIPF